MTADLVVHRQLRYGELDRDRVVTGLLALARRVGVEQITMRSLAAELGSSAPALYYHVPNKQTALDLLAESLLDQIAVPTSGDWEAQVAALYAAARASLLSVRGITTVLQTRPLSASGRRLENTAQTVLREAGFPAPKAAYAVSLLSHHLLGCVALEHASLGAASAATASRRSANARFTFGLRVILSGLLAERALL
jgi:TetR/AcrR family tetracycline transcriptional repressor